MMKVLAIVMLIALMQCNVSSQQGTGDDSVDDDGNALLPPSFRNYVTSFVDSQGSGKIWSSCDLQRSRTDFVMLVNGLQQVRTLYDDCARGLRIEFEQHRDVAADDGADDGAEIYEWSECTRMNITCTVDPLSLDGGAFRRAGLSADKRSAIWRDTVNHLSAEFLVHQVVIDAHFSLVDGTPQLLQTWLRPLAPPGSRELLNYIRYADFRAERPSLASLTLPFEPLTECPLVDPASAANGANQQCPFANSQLDDDMYY
jgi:hypothetical protein